VGENVRGLTNWNGGLVFDEVQTELEAEGYEVLPFLLPACSVGAPHRRDRIWFIAYSNCNRLHRCNSENEVRSINNRLDALGNFNEGFSNGYATNSKNIGQKYALENGELERRRFGQLYKRNVWNTFPSVSAICGGDDGLPKELDNITFSKWRQESLKAYGNAIVPQVAYQIFKSICQYQEL
jgi:DNA (cytosine-5)-methyltransferase 1